MSIQFLVTSLQLRSFFSSMQDLAGPEHVISVLVCLKLFYPDSFVLSIASSPPQNKIPSPNWTIKDNNKPAVAIFCPVQTYQSTESVSKNMAILTTWDHLKCLCGANGWTPCPPVHNPLPPVAPLGILIWVTGSKVKEDCSLRLFPALQEPGKKSCIVSRSPLTTYLMVMKHHVGGHRQFGVHSPFLILIKVAACSLPTLSAFCIRSMGSQNPLHKTHFASKGKGEWTHAMYGGGCLHSVAYKKWSRFRTES